ncbi:MAG TPA: multiheme c-type cytochrome [Candidatus Eisenbacteria bacterium]|nr:multiheme c-type cytochrome [Candidatus Eisenbacteria bacterium]
MLRSPSRLIPALALGALLAGCGSAPSVVYRVTISPATPHAIDVSSEWTAVPRDSLVLGGFETADHLKISRFEATDLSGAALPVRSTVGGMTAEGRTLLVPRYVIVGPLPSRIRVRDLIDPDIREGDAHVGFSSVRYGYVGQQFAEIGGRNLFLLPMGPLGDVRVRFELPPGWIPVTPWAKKGGEFQPGIQGRFRDEHLIASTLAFGPFVERSMTLGKTRYRFAYLPGSVDSTLTAFEHVARTVRAVVGGDLGREYVTAVLPTTPDGSDIHGEPWATGQGGTLTPITASRLLRYAEALLQARLKFEPYRSEIERPDEYWLVDGITNLYAWRAVAAAGLVQESEIENDLATSYAAARHVAGVEHDLERLYETKLDTELARRVEAPYVLHFLDGELRARSGGRETLDAVVRRMLRSRRAPSLWTSFEGGGHRDWDRFRDRFVRGNEAIPPRRETGLALVEPTPTPPVGRPVHDLTVLFTGDTSGFLEHCGCKVNQSGGVARRATMIERLRREHPDAPLLDLGNAFAKPETPAELDYLARQEQRLYLQTMATMGYDAVAVGTNELLYGTGWFREATKGLGLPYLSGNVLEHGATLEPAWRVVRARGLRIAIVSVLEPPHGPDALPQFEASTTSLRFADPVAAVERSLSEIGDRADFTIVIGRLESRTIQNLVLEVPGIDLILSNAGGTSGLVQASGAPETTGDQGFLRRTLILHEDSRNYGLESVDLRLDDSSHVASARTTHHWLYEDVPDDPTIRAMLTRFYEQVGTRDSAQASVRPLFPTSKERLEGIYVGASRCATCHRLEFDQWKTTRHATAYKTLLDAHRHYQPRCIVCHVVGFRTAHGYKLGDPEEPLANVQCEVCHGPGGAHVAAPATARMERTPPESTCLECHNPQHSDAFVYSEKIRMVQHRAEVASTP